MRSIKSSQTNKSTQNPKGIYVKLLMVLTLLSFVAGCSNFTSPARQHKLDDKGSYWLDYDASRRGTVIIQSESPWKICSEPAPDVAVGIVAKLTVKAGQEAELTQSIVNLATKTQMVLFLRESLFRLCELSINVGLTVPQATTLYKSVIDSALALVKKEKAQIDLERERLTWANRAQSIFYFATKEGIKSGIVQEFLKTLE